MSYYPYTKFPPAEALTVSAKCICLCVTVLHVDGLKITFSNIEKVSSHDPILEWDPFLFLTDNGGFKPPYA